MRDGRRIAAVGDHEYLDPIKRLPYERHPRHRRRDRLGIAAKHHMDICRGTRPPQLHGALHRIHAGDPRTCITLAHFRANTSVYALCAIRQPNRFHPSLAFFP